MPEECQTVYSITVHLTDRQLNLLRRVVSKLGQDNAEGVFIQLEIANAILDRTIHKEIVKKIVDPCKNGTCNCDMH